MLLRKVDGNKKPKTNKKPSNNYRELAVLSVVLHSLTFGINDKKIAKTEKGRNLFSANRLNSLLV